jgi:tRNA dimethylallyltransferase
VTSIPSAMSRPPVLVIAGPTASGKSALALRAATELDGDIVNADSMQVYRDFRILTARPTAEDEARAAHRLYGYVDAACRYSAGRWREAAVEAIEAAYAAGRQPIVVGGTGFYIDALLHGLSPIPDVPPGVTTTVAREAARQGLTALRAKVADIDPVAAERIGQTDRQRLVRALAVYEATGRPLSHWQSLAPAPPSFSSKVLWLNPPRAALYQRCDSRLERMLAEGALDEVGALLARSLDPSLPAMKALGVAEIGGYLQGRLGREAALSAAQQATRRFAKRQLTWLRNRLRTDCRIDAQFSESLWPEILPFIRAIG